MSREAKINFSLKQKCFALAWGVICHMLFVCAIGAMAYSLFNGMQVGYGLFQGYWAWIVNFLLLLSFPFGHSLALSSRGKRLLQKITPFELGKELLSTTFVSLSSLQLMFIFFAWSPSGLIWWEAPVRCLYILIPLAGVFWALLGKSMYDAQLSVQLGYLGWLSILKNKQPNYESFSRKGIYRKIRQPIYLSFALILWTSSVWSVDQLILASGWTAYCFFGAKIKEKRFLRFFGNPFSEYQKEVPFWIPKFHRRDS